MPDQYLRLVDGIEFLGSVEIPSGTDFEGTVIGGLSGIVYDPASKGYLAVSDDFSEGEPNRYYHLDLDLADGFLDAGDVTITAVVALDPNDVLPGPADTEGVAIGADGQIYISTERNLDGRFPQIIVVADNGLVTDELRVDAKFLGTSENFGVRDNLGFESLTITPDATTLYAATEGALFQDGARASQEAGSPARIVQYDLTSGEAMAEYIYEVDPIAAEPFDAGLAGSGLVELLALDNQGTLLALERSFSAVDPAISAEVDRGYTGKLFIVRTQGATNVIAEDNVPTATDEDGLDINVDKTAEKELLLDLDDLGIVIDNIEGMTLGPVLEDGRQTLTIVSDDNFGGFGPQSTQFIALGLDLGEVPTMAPTVETPEELRFAPILIGHRGASGELPEHTLEAYGRAIADGADFIEPDLVSTADGVLIARHEPWLALVETDDSGEVALDQSGHPVIGFASTDIAEVAKINPDFMARLTTKDIGFSSDGLFGSVTGWFAEDFTLEEIKTLRAVEDQPDLRPQSALFDGLFEIPTLDEIIDLVQAHEARTGAPIGIYPETKEPSYFDAIGLSLEETLIQTLVDRGFTDPDRVFIQSFEVANLLDLQENVMPAAGVDLPLVQLLFNAPGFATYDLVEEAQTGGDFSRYDSLGFDAATLSGDLFTPEGLSLISQVYAEGVGPTLTLIINEDGSETSLVDDAQQAGLLVHGYTHADERTFIGVDGMLLTGADAYRRLVQTGVDGIFTDNPGTGRAVTDLLLANAPHPSDAAVWVNPDEAAASVVIAAMKHGGLRVYDLEGTELQRIEPDGIRYNNVDILYGVEAGEGEVDLAVVSDRASDSLAIFQIGADGTLTDVTSDGVPGTIFGIDDGAQTAYGVAAYTSPVDGSDYVFVTQGEGAKIAQLEVAADGDNFTFAVVRELHLPVPDGADPADFQSAGIAIDRETGTAYLAVETELGLLTFDAEPDGDGSFTTIVSTGSAFFRPDLAGVSIYYGEDGTGLIIVASQGDGTFAVFDRQEEVYLGSFAIRGQGQIDAVEETEGIEIFSGALPGFENGLLVTQDGSNEVQVVFGDPEDGEIRNQNMNFKYTDLGQVLELFGQATNPGFDPRQVPPSPNDIDTTPEHQPLEGTDDRDAFLLGPGFSALFWRDRITGLGESDLTAVSVPASTGLLAGTGSSGTQEVLGIQGEHGWVILSGGEPLDRFTLLVAGTVQDIGESVISASVDGLL